MEYRHNFQHTQTQKLGNFEKELENTTRQILLSVHTSLREKSYNPVSQIVGYILSGDPTYITSHQGARSLICKLERDEILEALVTFYLDNNSHN